jgi:hypothetical protein
MGESNTATTLRLIPQPVCFCPSPLSQTYHIHLGSRRRLTNLNPKPKSESEATCGIDEINLDLPHSLIGNIVFRCSKGPQETERMYKNFR